MKLVRRVLSSADFCLLPFIGSLSSLDLLGLFVHLEVQFWKTQDKAGKSSSMALGEVDIKSMMLCHKSLRINQMISPMKFACVSYMSLTTSLLLS